jgi:hypothetical protein
MLGFSRVDMNALGKVLHRLFVSSFSVRSSYDSVLLGVIACDDFQPPNFHHGFESILLTH